ncbi:MAG: hypothetical protein P8Z75_09505 [Gammaproteobacteria bacterium]|jgi:hypothetical protein
MNDIVSNLSKGLPRHLDGGTASHLWDMTFPDIELPATDGKIF